MTYIQSVIVNYVTEFITGREGLIGDAHQSCHGCEVQSEP